MNNKNSKIYIIGALRTPVGKLNGALSAIRPDDMGALLVNQLTNKYHITKEKVDSIILGCANQAGEDNRNLARMVGILSGLPYSTTANTVNSLCASGMEAIISATRTIACGENDLVLAGGIESMSRSPLIQDKKDKSIVDSLIGWRFVNPQMSNICPTLSMPETAELLAHKYNITKEQQDYYAYQSRQKYELALQKGLWKEELAALKNSKNENLITDEQHRILSLDLLSKLPKLVKNGTNITSGNAARVGDGGALVALASENFIRTHKIKPLASINNWAVAACHPSEMSLSAVAACHKLFAKSTITINDLDHIELSESFAVQAIACIQALEFPLHKTNPNGGAISIGNPIAMSSARLVVSLVHQMQRDSKAQYGLATSCAGLGIGTALLLEKS